MAIDAIGTLGLLTITIFIGYVGSLLFRRTGISDIIFLMLLGLLLGPGLNLIDRGVFIEALPLLSALALILILFDSGLNMDFYQMVRGFSRSMVFTVVGVGVSALAVALVLSYVVGLGLLESVMLGVIFGGTTTASVTAIVNRARAVGKETKTILTLESVFTDPLTIIIPIAIIGIMTAQSYSDDLVFTSLKDILSSFSVAAVIGTLAGLVWLFVTDKLKERKLGYMITLAALFMVYIVVESLHFSGAISSLLFGLVIGNRHTFYEIFKVKHKHKTSDGSIRSFQNEITFFIRAFFFVYLGLIATLSLDTLLYGAMIVGAVAVARLAVVQISTVGMEISRQEKNIMRVMVPKGLAVAVVSQIPVYLGLPNAEIYSSLAFAVILGTNVYAAVASFLVLRK